MASVIELQYNRQPLLIPKTKFIAIENPSIDDEDKYKALRTIVRMPNRKKRTNPTIRVAVYAFFCQNHNRWICLAKVISIEHGIVKLIFNEQIFTSIINRVMKTIPQFNTDIDHYSQRRVVPSASDPDTSPNEGVQRMF